MCSRRIVAITGVKCSGKDLVSNYLASDFGYTNVKVASTLKSVIKILFDMTSEQVDGQKKEQVDERWGITPRTAMQFIGTELMQFELQRLLPDVGRKFWIKKLCMELHKSPMQKFAISDVRFPHEIEELRKEFGSEVFVLMLKRPCLDVTDTHSSEQEWKEIVPDTIVINNGTVEQLHETISTIFSQ